MTMVLGINPGNHASRELSSRLVESPEVQPRRLRAALVNDSQFVRSMRKIEPMYTRAILARGVRAKRLRRFSNGETDRKTRNLG
jgi:hypothetical protein